MTRDGLRLPCREICIVIVFAAVTNQNAAHLLEPLDQVTPLHLGENEFLYFADKGNFARFEV